MMNNESEKPLVGAAGRGREASERSDDARHDRRDGVKGLSLLLVEDDEVIRESFLDWLASVLLDSDIVGVSSDAVSSLRPARLPQVIVVDVALPGDGGIDIVRSLHHVFPAAQIVALVVGGERQPCEAIKSAGAEACLPIWKVHEGLVPIVRRLGRA